jgi:DNA-binding NarL/FixJ family response regulator
MNSSGDISMFYVLLVDTNVNYREALADILCAYFPLIDVVEASDCAEALRKVEYIRPNIIFMDIQLPDKNGLELIKEIKQNYVDIVIVILSNNKLSEYHQLAFRNGADCYIPKRQDSCMEEILTRIERAMANRTPN